MRRTVYGLSQSLAAAVVMAPTGAQYLQPRGGGERGREVGGGHRGERERLAVCGEGLQHQRLSDMHTAEGLFRERERER